jgi:hypothetical protein
VNKYVRDALTFPRDASAAWKHRGASGVWRELRVRTVDRVTRRGLALLIEHSLADLPSLPLPQGVRIAPFAGPDWTPFLAITTPARVEGFRRRMARGRECLVAWRGEQPVGFTWISRRIDRDLESYSLPLPPDTTYHWDLFVTSSERGNGLGTGLAFARLDYVRNSCRAAWRLVDIDNSASHRTVARTAAPSTRVVGELRYISVLGHCWSRYTPGAVSPETMSARAALEHAR